MGDTNSWSVPVLSLVCSLPFRTSRSPGGGCNTTRSPLYVNPTTLSPWRREFESENLKCGVRRPTSSGPLRHAVSIHLVSFRGCKIIKQTANPCTLINASTVSSFSFTVAILRLSRRRSSCARPPQMATTIGILRGATWVVLSSLLVEITQLLNEITYSARSMHAS